MEEIKMKIGDNVKTNDYWNRNHNPMQGRITKIIPSHGIDLPVIELDDGKCRINGFWLVKNGGN